jgi:hypothetical protein
MLNRHVPQARAPARRLQAAAPSERTTAMLLSHQVGLQLVDGRCGVAQWRCVLGGVPCSETTERFRSSELRARKGERQQTNCDVRSTNTPWNENCNFGRLSQ